MSTSGGFSVMLFLGGFLIFFFLNFSLCGFVSGGGGDVVWVRGGFLGEWDGFGCGFLGWVGWG